MADDESACPTCGHEREAGAATCPNCGRYFSRPPATAATRVSEPAIVALGILAGLLIGFAYTFVVVLAISTLPPASPRSSSVALLAAAQIVPFGLCFYFAIREARRRTLLGSFLLAFGIAALFPTAGCDIWLATVR